MGKSKKVSRKQSSKMKISQCLKNKKKKNLSRKVVRGKPVDLDKAVPSTSSCVQIAPDDEDLIQLKQFDLAWEYGPCIGITRLERWQRANKNELNPPKEIEDILRKHKSDKKYQECVWFAYKSL